jgi:hypothetical protein
MWAEAWCGEFVRQEPKTDGAMNEEFKLPEVTASQLLDAIGSQMSGKPVIFMCVTRDKMDRIMKTDLGRYASSIGVRFMLGRDSDVVFDA